MKYKQNLRIEGNKVISYTTHVATIDHAARKLIVHGWWSVTTSKHINHVAETYGLTKVDDKQDERPNDEGSGLLKAVSMVAAFGAILCPDQKSKNDWQARMLKAGLGDRGLVMPENWDQLSEDEKETRLTKALQAITP